LAYLQSYMLEEKGFLPFVKCVKLFHSSFFNFIKLFLGLKQGNEQKNLPQEVHDKDQIRKFLKFRILITLLNDGS
jgi:hypothetical protein